MHLVLRHSRLTEDVKGVEIQLDEREKWKEAVTLDEEENWAFYVKQHSVANNVYELWGGKLKSTYSIDAAELNTSTGDDQSQ